MDPDALAELERLYRDYTITVAGGGPTARAKTRRALETALVRHAAILIGLAKFYTQGGYPPPPPPN